MSLKIILFNYLYQKTLPATCTEQTYIYTANTDTHIALGHFREKLLETASHIQRNLSPFSELRR